MNQVKAAYLDIDHTLFDSSRLGDRFLEFAEQKFNWPATEVLTVVDSIRDQLFSWRKFYEHLPGAWRARISFWEFDFLVSRSFADTRDCLYPDVLPLLQRLREADWQSFLCTFGDRDFQVLYKVINSGLGEHFPPENIFCTGTPGSKGRIIAENNRLLGTAKSLFVDDNLQEIEGCAEIKHKTGLFLLDRGGTGRPDMEKTADLRYNYLNNLDQLPL